MKTSHLKLLTESGNSATSEDLGVSFITIYFNYGFILRDYVTDDNAYSWNYILLNRCMFEINRNAK